MSTPAEDIKHLSINTANWICSCGKRNTLCASRITGIRLDCEKCGKPHFIKSSLVARIEQERDSARADATRERERASTAESRALQRSIELIEARELCLDVSRLRDEKENELNEALAKVNKLSAALMSNIAADSGYPDSALELAAADPYPCPEAVRTLRARKALGITVPGSADVQVDAEIIVVNDVEYYSHVPGNNQPCADRQRVLVAYDDGTFSECPYVSSAFDWGKSGPHRITGWRPAGAPDKLPKLKIRL